MPINLVPQDYQQVGDTKGRRKKVRPDNLNSGTLYGQYQLRGSILTIKDSMDAVSGYMAFGTDMTTIPTGASAGTGIYIDYTGIYGLASNVQQAYMRASDGKIVAGAGAVTLDVNGIAITSGNTSPHMITWTNDDSGTTRTIAQLHAYGSGVGGANSGTDFYHYIHPTNATYNATSYLMTLRNNASSRSAKFYMDVDRTVATSSYAAIYGTGFVGLAVGAANQATTNSMLEVWGQIGIYNSAPKLLMQDSTASAKSLLVTTDANLTKFEEAGGAASNLLVLDLAKRRVGIGTASPAIAKLSFGSGLGDKIALWEDGSSILGFGIQSALFQIYAGASTDRVGIGYGSSSSFTETLTVKSSGVGIGSTSPSASTLTLGDAYNIVVNTTTGTKIGTGTTQKLGFWNATPVVQNTGWGSITNVTTDRAYDANATTTDELADVLGTLIAQLVTYGILGA